MNVFMAEEEVFVAEQEVFVAEEEVFVAEEEVFVAEEEVFVAEQEVFVAEEEVLLAEEEQVFTHNEWWTWQHVPLDSVSDFEHFPFLEKGVRVRMKDNATVLDYFELYLTDTIVGHIVTETNRYAGQFLAANPEKATNTYLKYWEPVTRNEMKKFIVILLLMGIIYKPTLHMYWSTDERYATPIFNELTMCDHFDLFEFFSYE